MSDFRDHLNRLLAEDPEFRKEWERSEALYNVIGAVLRRRSELGITQAELAARMGKKQPAIARFEAGNAENPTLSFLQQLAKALDMELKVELQPRAKAESGSNRAAEEQAKYSAS